MSRDPRLARSTLRLCSRPHLHVFLSNSICSTYKCGRDFSTSWPLSTHYDTLGVPKNASKNQIKSTYFKLSKKYHPDLSKDPAATDKFYAISNAYSVLGDERQKRAYDRSLSAPTNQATSSSPYYYEQWSSETRRRGATHAWEHPRRHRQPPGTGHHRAGQQRGTGRPYANPQTDPFSSPNVRRATGAQRAAERKAEEDRIAEVSGFWRAVQVLGLVAIIGTLGGGWSANAG